MAYRPPVLGSLLGSLFTVLLIMSFRPYRPALTTVHDLPRAEAPIAFLPLDG
jgi:hypothetical protein